MIRLAYIVAAILLLAAAPSKAAEPKLTACNMSGDPMEVVFAWRSSIGVFVDSFQLSSRVQIGPGNCSVLLTGAEMVHAYVSVHKQSWFGLMPQDVDYNSEKLTYRTGDAMVTPARRTMCIGPARRQASLSQLSSCAGGVEKRLFSIWVNADSYNPVELNLY